jgi:hypothetical protein
VDYSKVRVEKSVRARSLVGLGMTNEGGRVIWRSLTRVTVFLISLIGMLSVPHKCDTNFYLTNSYRCDTLLLAVAQNFNRDKAD